MFVVALLALQTRAGALHTPYAQAERVAIRSTHVVSPQVQRLEVEEIEVDARGTFDNPFDPDDVDLTAHVSTPEGHHYDVPGFFYRPFTRELASGKEVLHESGEPSWRVRIAPKEAGEYRVDLELKDRNGVAKRSGIRFNATKEGLEGMIKVSPRDRRYFEFDNGKSFYPVGANVAWGGDQGTFAYDQWLGDYGHVGANFARLWLSPSWTTFGMDQSGKPSEGKGMGQFDLGNAWRLDYTFDLAKRNHMFLQLCLESFNVLRDRDNAPWWEKTPQNSDNGGPLRVWSDFWTNGDMDRLFKMKLRYLVARYSAYSNLFAWELFNEVDLVRDFQVKPVRDWHQRMAAELHRIDPNDHPVTTSLSNTQGNRDIDLVPELQFFQSHIYNAPDLAGTVVDQQSRKQWGRPHLIGEIGADSTGPRAKDDPDGMQIHDPMWMSIASGVSGASSPWWWDNYIATNHLYSLFNGPRKFTEGIDWPGEAFQLVDPTFGYPGVNKKPPLRDLILDGGPQLWQASSVNRPASVQVSEEGVTGPIPLSGLQHGLRNHPEFHNPVQFRVETSHPIRFDVMVGDVSGYGGATLRVDLDGEHVMTRDFPSTDSVNHAPLNKFAGRYSINVPKGIHTVKVEDIGADWFTVAYRFTDLIPRAKPPIDGWALLGNETVLGWFRAEGRTWRRVCGWKETATPAPPTVVGIVGLPAGKWTVEYWDTWKGIVTSTETISVRNDGKARVSLPRIDTDIAIKMRRQP